MGVGIDLYMMDGIRLNTTLLEKMIDEAEANDENGEFIRGLVAALDAIEHQLKTFPWD